MTHNSGGLLRHLRRLLATVPTEGFSDGQLLERYVAHQEETAFAVLLERHGPMVLGVCRRLLPDSHDVDDVFQATFLVLLRRASSVARYESVGGWLHGVAYRIAQRARINAARHHAQHRQVEDMVCTDSAGALAGQDLRPVLDEELQRLPEKYRQPIVLCYLEGRTTEEAAQQLGCPFGTVSSRLARARDLLRARLTRRGLTVASGALAMAVAENAAPASMSPDLVAATLRLGSLFVAGEAAVNGGASASVTALAEGAVRAMSLARVRVAVTLLLAFGMAGIGTAMVARHALTDEPHTADPEAVIAVPDRQVPEQQTRIEKTPAIDAPPASPLSLVEMTRWQQGQAVYSVAYSPDGKAVVTAGNVLALQLWDVQTGKRLRQFPGHDNVVPAAAFSPDGKVLASGGHDRTVRLWDANTGKELRRWKKHGNNVLAVTFSRDGQRLASAEGEGVVIVWDATSGEMLQEFRSGQCAFYSIGFSPDGSMLAGGGHSQRLFLWDVNTGEALHTLQLPSAVRAVAFSPDGRTLASGSEDGLIRLWDPARGKELGRLGDEKDVIFSVAFSPDGKTLAAGTAKHTLRLWELATTKEIPCTFDAEEPPTEGRSVAFAPNGRTLLVGCKDGTLRLLKLSPATAATQP